MFNGEQQAASCLSCKRQPKAKEEEEEEKCY